MSMAEVDASRRPDPRAYMYVVAATDQGREYKQSVLADLDLHPGLTALDVGCGPGTDLRDLAASVTREGSVIGVDHDRQMVREAAARVSDLPQVDVRYGDAHHLPVQDAGVDRIKLDRVLQHVASPADVFRELRRVCRPGAVAVLAEPDWATLAIDADDLGASSAFTRYTCDEVVRNASIGRRLARLGSVAGFEVRSIRTSTPLFLDFEVADRLLGLTRNSPGAVQAGYLSGETADRWLTALRHGPFLATVVLFVVALAAPE
jgi:SAM-dependent methyltransferase